MLATGTLADAIGVSIPALVSQWPYLTEMLGGAGIPSGHTAPEITAALDALTIDDLTAARAAMRALRPGFEWAPLAHRTEQLFDRVILND